MSKFRIARNKYAIALTHGASATTATAAAAINGLLSEIIIVTPAAVDATATITVNIIDQDNVTVYTKSSIAANTTSVNLLANDAKVPLCGTQTVQIVFSAAQTVTDTTTSVICVVDRG